MFRFLLLGLLLSMQPIFLQKVSAETIGKNTNEQLLYVSGGHVCDAFEKVSKAIMWARQSGVPLEKSLEGIRDDDAIGSIEKKIILEAYSEPISEDSFKKETIVNNFKSNIISRCKKGEFFKDIK